MSESMRRIVSIDPAGFIPFNVNERHQSDEEAVPHLPEEQQDKSHSSFFCSFNEGCNGVSRLNDC